jgi:uncharacterized Zn-binding protein involved in type VI secretion/pimeloyl-ACP methyl ester carboxylesterase
MSDAPQAARLGDNHLCPQHLGKIVATNTAPTILIEGRPAARVTSQLVCIGGPLDTVAMGEPTVLMMGLDAARMLDGTLHGGLISEGAPTVLIGSMSAMDKRLRLLARLMLIDQARKKAANMPEGPDKQAMEAAANRLAENNKVVEDARLALDVYNDSGAPEGWTRLSPGDLPPEMQGATLHDDKSGFYADVYRSEIDGSYKLVFRGSERKEWKDAQDWINNAEQATGHESKQYEEAVKLAQQFAAAYGTENTSIAGHSLGGGLASAASLETGIPATTFNASGLSDHTMNEYGLDPSKANELINVYQTDGEVLTWLQENSPVAGRAPDAVGTKHSLPAYDYDEATKTLTPRSDPAAPTPSAPRPWWNPRNPVLDWAIDKFKDAKHMEEFLMEAIHRHTDSVVGGVEKQKADDIGTIMNGLASGPKVA